MKLRSKQPEAATLLTPGAQGPLQLPGSARDRLRALGQLCGLPSPGRYALDYPVFL